MIHYLQGDATKPQGDGNKIIAHVCNDIGGWGKGFVLALSKRWTRPEEAYRFWYATQTEPLFTLGQVQLVEVEPKLWVANMLAQRGIKKKQDPSYIAIRYEALNQCLEKLAQMALQRSASIHMPRIGCGLAGGKWEEVEPLILAALCRLSLPVYVYDL